VDARRAEAVATASRMLMPPLVRAILTVAGLLVGPVAAGQMTWDPPGVVDFPDHAAVAASPSHIPRMIDAGRRLFQTRFTRRDGAGRPSATGDSKPTSRPRLSSDLFNRSSGPDGSACSGCHNQGRLGGAGDFAASVFVGSKTRYAVATPDQGSATNSRHPPALFGSGMVEMLAREMTHDLLSLRDKGLSRARRDGVDRTVLLRTKGIDFGFLVARPDGSYDTSGVRGVDADLIVKPFGWRGQAVSLRDFTIHALNQHHGIQAIERFGWERTGRLDFDDDGVEVELTIGQTSALALFLAALPPPWRVRPSDPVRRAAVERGELTFERIGCTDCHRPSLPLSRSEFTEPNPYNPPGTLTPQDGEGIIRIQLPSGVGELFAYTDLKRHRICDGEDSFFCNESDMRDEIPPDQFLTARLWNVGAGGPYSHRGDCGTVSEAIVHHSGEAAPARRRFLALSDAEKEELVAFLLTLGAPEAHEADATMARPRTPHRRRSQ